MGDPWNYGPPSDMWTCGFIAYWMLSLKLPFDGKDNGQNNRGSEQVSFSSGKWDSISAEAKDFISKLLSNDRTERLSATDALQHPWITKFAPTNTDLSSTSSSGVLGSLQKTRDSQYNVDKFGNQFNLESKLKQLTKSLIASQLLLQGEKELIDDAFVSLDISKTGKLSKDQVKDGYQMILGKALKDEEVDEMFRRISSDGYIQSSAFVIATMNEKDLLCNESLGMVEYGKICLLVCG